jgi:hypothetical protein
MRAPHPGVLLEVRAEQDCARRLRAAIKDAAQGAGVVIGGLRVTSVSKAGSFITTADFSTPTPALGAAVARYVVDGLNAAEAGDETWDAEERLWDLAKRRRVEALPLAALQIQAEAAARGVPAFVRPDGQLQLGYGTCGFTLDLAPLRTKGGSSLAEGSVGVGPPPFARAAEALVVPWDRLGTVPVVAVVGGADRAAAFAQLASLVAARGGRVAAQDGCGFDAARALLADWSADAVVVGLEPDELVQRGCPFARCVACALVSLPDELPAGAASRQELARALGVPLLLTDPAGAALLGNDHEIAALADHARCRLVSQLADLV